MRDGRLIMSYEFAHIEVVIEEVVCLTHVGQLFDMGGEVYLPEKTEKDGKVPPAE